MKGLQVAQLAVLDGDSLDRWSPWGCPFQALKAEFDSLEVEPFCLRVRRRFKLELLPHSPQELFRRTTWSAVVGALVDGMNPTEDLKRKHRRLCEKLRDEDADPLFRKVGYYITVLVRGAPQEEQTEFVSALNMQARDALGENYVAVLQDITDLPALRAHLRYCVREMMYKDAQSSYR